MPNDKRTKNQLLDALAKAEAEIEALTADDNDLAPAFDASDAPKDKVRKSLNWWRASLKQRKDYDAVSAVDGVINDVERLISQRDR